MPDYTTYEITNDDSSTFTALSPEDAMEKQLDPREGLQNIIFISNWVYASGNKPKIVGPIITISTSGSKIVMQEIPATTTDPRILRCILLSGSSGATVTMNDDSDSRAMTATDYVDVIDDPSGAYIGEGGTFDGDNTSGSEGLMAAINAARTATGVD